jgi:rhodanese-related sulfurtransferase
MTEFVLKERGARCYIRRMKGYLSIALRSLIIVVVASLIGLGVNLVSPKTIPWIYERPAELTIDGRKIPLIDEAKAFQFFEDVDTVFVDTRDEEDYSKAHIKGAISLPASSKETRFEAVQPFVPEEARVILYCGGPDCEMAQKVAHFLAPFGYKRITIMQAGFPAWEKANYPVERASR